MQVGPAEDFGQADGSVDLAHVLRHKIKELPELTIHEGVEDGGDHSHVWFRHRKSGQTSELKRLLVETGMEIERAVTKNGARVLEVDIRKFDNIEQLVTFISTLRKAVEEMTEHSDWVTVQMSDSDSDLSGYGMMGSMESSFSSVANDVTEKTFEAQLKPTPVVALDIAIAANLAVPDIALQHEQSQTRTDVDDGHSKDHAECAEQINSVDQVDSDSDDADDNRDYDPAPSAATYSDTIIAGLSNHEEDKLTNASGTDCDEGKESLKVKTSAPLSFPSSHVVHRSGSFGPGGGLHDVLSAFSSIKFWDGDEDAGDVEDDEGDNDDSYSEWLGRKRQWRARPVQMPLPTANKGPRPFLVRPFAPSTVTATERKIPTRLEISSPPIAQDIPLSSNVSKLKFAPSFRCKQGSQFELKPIFDAVSTSSGGLSPAPLNIDEIRCSTPPPTTSRRYGGLGSMGMHSLCNFGSSSSLDSGIDSDDVAKSL